MSEKTSYEILASLDVSKHVEKKGQLSYLSWAWAVDQLLRHDVEANWRHCKPEIFADGTMMVFCEVTAFGRMRSMQLPVMDYKNKAISNPDAFAINTAMMRCLVKAIALHGLGLYIYAGEDLPLAEDKFTENIPVKEVKPKLPKLSDADAEVAYNAWKAVKAALVAAEDDGVVDPETLNTEWFKRESNVRSAITAHGTKLAQAEAVAKMNERPALGGESDF